MRRFLLSSIVGIGLIGGAAAPVFAAPCKDAKGKFVKCPAAAAKPAPRCKNAKGHFAKCGAPGAKPM
jgi:hypothetical protein